MNLKMRATITKKSLVVLLVTMISPTPALASVTDFLEHLTGFMGEVPRAPGALGQSGERRMILNGQHLRVVTGRTQSSVRDTLSFYHHRFEEQSTAQKRGLRLVGVQKIRDDSGYIAMIDPESKDALVSVAEQRRSLLSAGPLRMVYAHRRGGETDYLVLFTNEALSDEKLRVDAAGDTPGRDVPDVPRPDGAVRTYNFYEPSAGYGLVSYLMPASSSPEDALHSARGRLRAAGFIEDYALQAATEQTAKLMAQFHRKGHSVLVSARARQKGGNEVTYLWRTE